MLVDLRGDGGSNRLDCDSGASDSNPQAYLDPLFADTGRYRACSLALSDHADLTQYTTEISMIDLDGVRQALGYDKINFEAGSYGTRAALAYLHRFGSHVRSMAISGVSPIENRAPLYHAAAAQRAFDRVASQCDADDACHRAFPDVRGDLDAVLASLRAHPAQVSVRHPVSGANVQITLTASAFADGLRVRLYSAANTRAVPYLLHRARSGDLVPFAQAALASSRNLVQSIRLGLMLSVTCAEDVSRIREDEVSTLAAGSFIGADRVRNQIAACAQWPRGAVSAAFFQPFSSDVPVLVVSGDLDPVTPPSWGEVARHGLSNSVHLITPYGHVENNPCVTAAMQTLFRTADTRQIDTSCAATLSLPPFVTDASQLPH